MKIFVYILLVLPLPVSSQVLIQGSKYCDVLKNGKEITLFTSSECASCYYYLPVNLGIARKADGTPEISLVTWKNDENSKVIGGIFHFLVHWGLSQEEEEYIDSRLKKNKDSVAVVLGPVTVESKEDIPLFEGDKLAQLLIAHLNHVPTVPTTPGAKMAFSFRFDEKGIEQLMQYVANPNRTVTKLIVSYTYRIKSEYGSNQVLQSRLELGLDELLKLIN